MELIVANGWNMGCTHSYYANVDFVTRRCPFGFILLGDIMYPEGMLDPNEIVFMKGNRNIELPWPSRVRCI